jgi:hypothetical protein
MRLQRHLIAFELKIHMLELCHFYIYIYLWICVHISILNRKQYYVITLRKRGFHKMNNFQ